MLIRAKKLSVICYKIITMQRILLKLFNEAVLKVNPSELIRSCVHLDPIKKEVNLAGKIYDSNLKYHVLGFGKAVKSMTVALQDILQQRIESGLIIVPHNTCSNGIQSIKVYTAAKDNLPDEMSLKATEEMLKLTSSIPENDIVIVLVSGGGSSLLCKPVENLTLEDKLLTINLLVQSGADIKELNTVRKALSYVKGGGLAKVLQRKRTICLILSDVVGNPLQTIASGATVANEDTLNSAWNVVKKYKLELKIPKYIAEIIKTPKLVKDVGDNIENIVIGSNNIALEHIYRLPDEFNIKKFFVSCNIEGFVTDVAFSYTKISVILLNFLNSGDQGKFKNDLRSWAREYSQFQILSSFLEEVTSGDVFKNGVLLLFGGETTVKLSGKGKGGRNQELSVIFSKLLFQEMDKHPEIFKKWDVEFLSAGTDGIDGPTDAAGAFGCINLIKEGNNQKLDVEAFLANNDTYNYLSSISNGKYLMKTGHTGTNVMDIHILTVFKKDGVLE